MAQKNRKLTQQEKLERERAIAERLERSNRRKRIAMAVFTIVLCVLLVFAFCFPALTTLIS